MLRITIQAAIVVVGLIASIIITNVYYNQTLQYLIHIEQLAHAAIPAVLAVALLYHVINITNRKKRP